MPTKPNHLLEGAIGKSIFMIAIPVITANALQTAYQLIDAFWVGRLGADAVAAVSVSFPIIFFLTSLAIGFLMAGSILTAQYNGRGDREKVNMTAGQTIAFVSVVAITIAATGFFASPFMISLLTTDPAVFDPADAYLKISFLSLPFLFLFGIFQSVLRGIGHTRLPMIIVLATVILNFALDPLFLFGWNFVPAMGVKGVAVATLITEILSAAIGVGILFSGKFPIVVHLKNLKLRREWVKKIIGLGLPSSLEMSSRSLGMIALTFAVATFGTLAVAAYGIGVRILMFIIIPAVGFSMATSSLVGNNLGARQKDRAEKISKTGIQIAFGVLSAVGVIVFLFATQIAAFLAPNETALIATTSEFLRIISPFFGLIGIQMVIIGTLRAAGLATAAMTLAITQTVLLIIFALGLSHFFDERGIWLAYPIANIFSAIIALAFYARKTWLKKEIL